MSEPNGRVLFRAVDDGTGDVLFLRYPGPTPISRGCRPKPDSVQIADDRETIVADELLSFGEHRAAPDSWRAAGGQRRMAVSQGRAARSGWRRGSSLPTVRKSTSDGFGSWTSVPPRPSLAATKDVVAQQSDIRGMRAIGDGPRAARAVAVRNFCFDPRFPRSDDASSPTNRTASSGRIRRGDCDQLAPLFAPC